MSELDRQKWNARYADGRHASSEPSILLTSVEALLPRCGRALDLAGGAGRHAIWLARRGLDVTLIDISDTALEIASQRAVEANVALHVQQVDLESDLQLSGDWDLIVLFHYLNRPLLAQISRLLAPGGVLFFVQPTVRNLERNPKPSRSFLLHEHEAPKLIQDLELILYKESWSAEDRHEAQVVARRPANGVH